LSYTVAKWLRGLKKHLKRLNAPKHWMLDKLGGAFAPKPSSGPHKSRECLPLILILRNRLKYALTYREVIAILMQRHVLVDGKVRTDKTYPSVSWMLCQSQRQMRASVSSMTPKAASGSTPSEMMMINLS
jgi:small subunit ribosomal protein S4e